MISRMINNSLIFVGEDIPEDVIQRVLPYLDDSDFSYERMKMKSYAAANLVNW